MTPSISPVLETNMFDLETASANLPGPGWMAQRRLEFVEKMKSAKFPTTEEELWRYTDINSFDLNKYRALSVNELGQPGEQKSPGGGVVAAEAGEHSALIIVRDGRVVHHSLSEDLEALGVVVTGIEEAQGEIQEKMLQFLGSVASETADTFVLLNEAMSIGGTYIYIPKSVVVPNPIVIVHWCEGDNVAVLIGP